MDNIRNWKKELQVLLPASLLKTSFKKSGLCFLLLLVLRGSWWIVSARILISQFWGWLLIRCLYPQICSYAPDLARSIAGLILSSSDSGFQKECISLLGLQSQEVEGKTVEDCIKKKIISVIEINDRKPQRSREVPSFLFENECIQEQDLQGEECEGEEAFNEFYQ